MHAGKGDDLMDEQRFDAFSRRVGELELPRLPRRGLMALLGGAALTGAIALSDDQDALAKKKNNKKKKCKKEGQGCDKKKCKKQNKKCCCNDLKCKNSVCEGTSKSCPTTVDFVNAWGSSGSGNGQFNNPWGITFDSNNNVYVTDTGNTRVQEFSASGNYQNKFGSQGDGTSQFQTPQGIGFNRNSQGNNRLNIADQGMADANRRLRQFQTNGTFDQSIGLAALSDPTGVGIDGNNNVWAVDETSPGEVFLFNSNGGQVTSWIPSGSGQLSNPQGITIFKDSSDNNTYVYVTDNGNQRVVKFRYDNNSNTGLVFINAAGSGGSGSSEFNRPVGIAADSCGNLWVADQNNNRVQVLDKNLNFKTRFTASMNRPTGVALNGSTLYVVNNVGNNVQRFSLS